MVVRKAFLESGGMIASPPLSMGAIAISRDYLTRERNDLFAVRHFSKGVNPDLISSAQLQQLTSLFRQCINAVLRTRSW